MKLISTIIIYIYEYYLLVNNEKWYTLYICYYMALIEVVHSFDIIIYIYTYIYKHQKQVCSIQLLHKCT